MQTPGNNKRITTRDGTEAVGQLTIACAEQASSHEEHATFEQRAAHDRLHPAGKLTWGSRKGPKLNLEVVYS